MVRLLGKKIPNAYLIGGLLLLAMRSPSRFTESTAAASSVGGVLSSIGGGLTDLTRGILPFSEIGTEFKDFSGGLSSLLDPIERLVDIGGRLVPTSFSPFSSSSPVIRQLSQVPEVEESFIPRNVAVPPSRIYGADY
jgi:hypothetical protein